MDRETLLKTIAEIAKKIEAEKEYLTELDTAIGDGDHAGDDLGHGVLGVGRHSAPSGHREAMSFSTRSSRALKGSLHRTVRCAWSLSFRWTQSTV